MRRIMLLVTVVALMVVLLAAAPALADKGGNPHAGSCGLGEGRAQGEIQNPTLPGASEGGLAPLGGCNGQQ